MRFNQPAPRRTIAPALRPGSAPRGPVRRRYWAKAAGQPERPLAGAAAGPARAAWGLAVPSGGRLARFFVGLERRTARGGRDSIDHAPGAHDDVANAVAGLVDVLITSKSGYDSSLSWVCGPYDDDGPPMIRTPRGSGRIDFRH